MLRTKTCGELSNNNISEIVTLCGWVQKNRDLGGMTYNPPPDGPKPTPDG